MNNEKKQRRTAWHQFLSLFLFHHRNKGYTKSQVMAKARKAWRDKHKGKNISGALPDEPKASIGSEPPQLFEKQTPIDQEVFDETDRLLGLTRESRNDLTDPNNKDTI